jgi:hypothetical protein
MMIRRRHRWTAANDLEVHLTWAEFDALWKVVVNGVVSADDDDLTAIGLYHGAQKAAARRVAGILRQIHASRPQDLADLLEHSRQHRSREERNRTRRS